jgi:hypothetical protein
MNLDVWFFYESAVGMWFCAACVVMVIVNIDNFWLQG